MNRKYLVVGVSLAAVALFAALALKALTPPADEGGGETATPPRTALMSDSCANAGGNWLAEHGECEYASKEWCTDEGGAFDECASACRHANPPAEICTLQCVPTCSFTASEAAVPEGELSGPELDPETAYGLVVGLMGHCVMRGECEKMEVETVRGADETWRVEVTERNLRDDSVRDRRTTLRAEAAETGWRLEEKLSEEFICQEGRGQQEFSPDLCI